jgi:hypothetical protein
MGKFDLSYLPLAETILGCTFAHIRDPSGRAVSIISSSLMGSRSVNQRNDCSSLQSLRKMAGCERSDHVGLLVN